MFHIFIIHNEFVFQELPDRISSDEERELLSLLCRVHELEADKVIESAYAEAVATFIVSFRFHFKLKEWHDKRNCGDEICSC